VIAPSKQSTRSSTEIALPAAITDAINGPLPESSGRNRRDFDLHVHTRTSSCGFITHQRVLDLARAAGRGVVAVTEHDTAAGAVAVRDLAARSGDDVLVLVGMELSTSDLGHVIVFGQGVETDWG
jgi:hypothetical protein